MGWQLHCHAGARVQLSLQRLALHRGVFVFVAIEQVIFPSLAQVDKLKDSVVLRSSGVLLMAKPHRIVKKANHGKRPSNAKGRRAKRRLVRT